LKPPKQYSPVTIPSRRVRPVNSGNCFRWLSKALPYPQPSVCAPLRAGIFANLSEINCEKSPSESVLRTTRSYWPPAKAEINHGFISARSHQSPVKSRTFVPYTFWGWRLKGADAADFLQRRNELGDVPPAAKGIESLWNPHFAHAGYVRTERSEAEQIASLTEAVRPRVPSAPQAQWAVRNSPFRSRGLCSCGAGRSRTNSIPDGGRQAARTQRPAGVMGRRNSPFRSRGLCSCGAERSRTNTIPDRGRQAARTQRSAGAMGGAELPHFAHAGYVRAERGGTEQSDARSPNDKRGRCADSSLDIYADYSTEII